MSNKIHMLTDCYVLADKHGVPVFMEGRIWHFRKNEIAVRAATDKRTSTTPAVWLSCDLGSVRWQSDPELKDRLRGQREWDVSGPEPAVQPRWLVSHFHGHDEDTGRDFDQYEVSEFAGLEFITAFSVIAYR